MNRFETYSVVVLYCIKQNNMFQVFNTLRLKMVKWEPQCTNRLTLWSAVVSDTVTFKSVQCHPGL